MQLRIRRFGSFTPALAAPDDVAKLFLLNLLFYLAEMALLFDVIASLAFVARHPTRARNLPTEEQATGSFAGIDNVTPVSHINHVPPPRYNPLLVMNTHSTKKECPCFTTDADAAG